MLLQKKARESPSTSVFVCTTNYSWLDDIRPRTILRQVFWLTDHHAHAPSRFSQWQIACALPVYSDEFAQDLHLFPFSPEYHIRYSDT